jgi:hypothetical protein
LDNDVICYELLGRADAAKIDRLKITPNQLLDHFLLRNEYIFQKIHNGSADVSDYSQLICVPHISFAYSTGRGS